MGRRRANHRNLLGVVACAVFAVFSNLRESIGANFVLEYFSESQHPYTAIHSLGRQNDFQSIDLYNNFGQNATFLFHPRVVVLSTSSAGIGWKPSHISTGSQAELDPALSSYIRDIGLEPSRMEMPEIESIDFDHQVYRTFEQEWFEDCEQVTKDKGTSTHVVETTCNSFHELDVVQLYNSVRKENSNATIRHEQSYIELLGVGSWRSVWKLNDGFAESISDGNEKQPELVLKLLHTHRHFDEKSFSIHQVDAFVMEALSASDYVVDSFGFCGQSVITEAATGSGQSLIKNNTLSSIDRLRIARDLARGLADLHALEAHPWETKKEGYNHELIFAHHDVNPANLVIVRDRQIRWNDFNLGLVNRKYKPFRRNDGSDKNHATLTECPVPVRYEQHLWRSPEECLNETGSLFLDREKKGRNTAAQAADVYSLGNILFYVLARHQPWSHLEEETNSTEYLHAKLKSGTDGKKESLLAIASAKIDGRLPNLPERYRTRPGARILWEAVKLCYTHEPRLRPSALEIADFLGRAHEKLVRKKDSSRTSKKNKHGKKSTRTKAVKK